jgi:hypothetical protein
MEDLGREVAKVISHQVRLATDLYEITKSQEFARIEVSCIWLLDTDTISSHQFRVPVYLAAWRQLQNYINLW